MTEEIRGTILVIEDEPALAKFLTWQLEEVGFDVHAELTGAGGLRYAADHRPDLVILDLMLPDLHGYHVCRELRKLFAPWTVPILIVTAMDRPIDQLRGFAFGTDAYLTKPYKSPELMETVELLLGQTMPN